MALSLLKSLKPVAGRALQIALNRALALDPDTRHALASLDGRHIDLTLEAPSLAMRISVDGDQLRVGPVDAQEADLAVRSSLAGVLAQLPLLANARRGDNNGKDRVRVAGDAELARRLQQLAKGFDPDWQQPFVSVFGEVLGVQVANTLRSALQHARQGRSIWPTAPLSSSPRSRAMWCRAPSWMPSTTTWMCCAMTWSALVHACSACGCRMKAVLRASRIGRVILRYRLDDLLQGTSAERWLRLAKPFVPRASASIASQSRGARLRLALQDLGPIFVKFGQILSTRRDLVPPDVANELTLLQDRVKPFDGETARRIVEDALGLPVSEAFASFDTEPLASASIAQVHAATLADGRQVVVKVLRPGIEKQIDADIALLNSLAALVERTHPRADKIRPREVVAEVENTLAAELDLQREGANASVLRRFWENSDDLYVPEVIWSHTAERALTLERVWGIPSDDIAALDKAGIDRKALAAKGVRVFYTQVFRDNFFHADAHAGNIWVDTDPARRANPRFIALDFGIMGQLSQEDQYYLAENFMAIFNRDYRRIAELHVQARWMPDHVRIDDLEAAVRSVCEPYFTRPLSQISLAEVLMKLFRVAQRYQLTLQPQLILLQKTLLNIEGVGRQLDPQIDIWAVAKPVLAKILRERYSPRRVVRELGKRLPEIMTHAPDMPRLVHAWLTQQVEGRHELAMRSRDLVALDASLQRLQKRAVGAITGVGLLAIAALMYVLQPPGWYWGDVPAWSWLSGAVGVVALARAWWR